MKRYREPLTFGGLIKNIRLTEYENMTQEKFADEIPPENGSRLSDFTNNNIIFSYLRQYFIIAKTLGHNKKIFCQL